MLTAAPRISQAGSGAILLDGAKDAFHAAVQQRVWAVAKSALDVTGVRETVPGMNNLLVVFDPLATDAAHLSEQLASLWQKAEPGGISGVCHVIPVSYGGAHGEDLAAWAAHCDLSVKEVVQRHVAASYTVAAVGAMPGFPYLSGLDPQLAWPRRATPRLRVEKGAVIIGGAQAGVMPMTAPSGWHIIGHTEVNLFDVSANQPVLLSPGDTIQFIIKDLEA